MKALLVGAGGMGRVWARTLHDHPAVEVVAWVDIREGASTTACKEEGLDVAHCCASLDEALNKANADFVVDVTTPESHHDVTLKALEAGLHVLGEKPMACSMHDAMAMVEASDRAGKLYMVSQNRRYNPQIVAFKQLISQNLGGCGILNADFYIGAHFGGFREEIPSPLILDMAIHTFDEARFLTGSDPVAVYAEEFNPPWSWYKGNAGASAIFEMSNGLRFTYRGSWCADGLPTSWNGDWRAVGPQGNATWKLDQPSAAEVVTKPGGFHSEVSPVESEAPTIEEGIKGSLAEFLSCLSGGPKPQGECHDNIKSLAMVFGAIESAKTGQRVAIAEVMK